MRYTRPPGLLDLDPETFQAHAWVQERLLQVFDRYGYAQAGAPSLEYRDLYEPTRMGAHLFHDLLLARLSESEEFPGAETSAGEPAGEPESTHDAALRPDFTTPLARRLIERLLTEGVPKGSVRRAYSGSVFRDVSADSERQKEFTQTGVELVGEQRLLGDLEILTLACDGAEALGLPEWRMHLGHAGLFKACVASLKLPPGPEQALLNNMVIAARLRLSSRMDSDATFGRLLGHRLPAMHRRVVASGMQSAPELLAPETLTLSTWRSRLPVLFEAWLRQVWVQERGLDHAAMDTILGLAALDPDPEKFFDELAPFLTCQTSSQASSTLQLLVQRIQERRGPKLALTPAASRGIGYYDGLTFELHSTQGALCGGGRYHGLHAWILDSARQTHQLRTGQLPAIPADTERMLSGVGLAWGVERIVSTLGGVPQAARPAPIAVTFNDPSLSQTAFALADRLRSKGFRVSQGLGEAPQSTLSLTLVDHSQGQVSLKHPGQAAILIPLSELEAHLESNHV